MSEAPGAPPPPARCPRVSGGGSGRIEDPGLTTSPPDRLRRHCSLLHGGFGRGRAGSAAPGFGRPAEKARRSDSASALGSPRATNDGSRAARGAPRGGIAGGMSAVRAAVGFVRQRATPVGAELRLRPVPGPAYVRAATDARNTLEGNKAHGRNGCRHAGNGLETQRTRRRSKALKSAALVVSKGPLGHLGGSGVWGVVHGFGC